MTLLHFAAALAGGVLGIIVIVRAGRSLARWTFAIGMGALAAESLCNGFTGLATSLERIVSWQQWKLLVVSLLPSCWVLFSASYTKRHATRVRNQRVAALIVGGLAFTLALKLIFGDVLLVSYHPIVSAERALLQLGWAGYLVHLTVLISAVLVLMNCERTYRASVGTIRWRIKFMLLGVAAIFAARLYTSSQTLLVRGTDPGLDAVNSGALLIGTLLVSRSLLRTGHFEVDVYPSQSVLSNSLTVLLAGIYLLVVGVLAKVVTYFGGDDTFALQALVVLLALVGLAVGLQSDRARLHVRRFISRHFQRPLYDYRTAWRKFSEATASQMDQRELSRTISALVAEIFQTLSVTTWLLDPSRERFGLAASTAVSSGNADASSPEPSETRDLVAHFENHPEPVDFEHLEQGWARALRRCHPDAFRTGGNRVCVPIIGRGQLLGLITVGDRVGGTPFSLQDFDMLKCIGDHAAASLLNVELSRQLSQSRELGAFQTMATFFVHDLKNAASTLNLMLENLPEHYDDPAFREDALRGVGKTVAHINHLIGRLTQLRQELRVSRAPADLNDLVEQAAAAWAANDRVRLVKRLTLVSSVPLDREQMLKVITNLLLNATDAVLAKTGGRPQLQPASSAPSSDAAARDQTSGQVSVTTAEEDGWAVLTVTDTGCGMSADFLRNSLFRPFQTTKKNGLGIGMFQSKMIIEAHAGRMLVESTPEQGTTFRVFLPLSDAASATPLTPSAFRGSSESGRSK